ncbi:hypothetical protein [Sporolactobacillus terrae]|uniref:hypothetical protein n=1 Tax=Sporolactobacillus terrae TaxID=269673 RepID=UPI000B1736C3|nr:hypothetical protein [Sporolactobacillus terrae]
MNEVMNRISELEKIRSGLKKLGCVWSERWVMAELAEMKVVLKRMKKASGATETC